MTTGETRSTGFEAVQDVIEYRARAEYHQKLAANMFLDKKASLSKPVKAEKGKRFVLEGKSPLIIAKFTQIGYEEQGWLMSSGYDVATDHPDTYHFDERNQTWTFIGNVVFQDIIVVDHNKEQYWGGLMLGQLDKNAIIDKSLAAAIEPDKTELSEL